MSFIPADPSKIGENFDKMVQTSMDVTVSLYYRVGLLYICTAREVCLCMLYHTCVYDACFNLCIDIIWVDVIV